MKLTISGAPKGTGVNQLLLRKASNYYTSILMKDDTACLHAISVEVRLIPNLNRDHNSDAFCSWLDRPINPHQFLLELDADLKRKTSLIALAHEFVHIKQLAFGEKQQSLDGSRMRWMGQIMDHSTIHYYDQPWEIEALGREYGLFDRFVGIEQGLNSMDIDPVIVDDNEVLLRMIKR